MNTSEKARVMLREIIEASHALHTWKLSPYELDRLQEARDFLCGTVYAQEHADPEV